MKTFIAILFLSLFVFGCNSPAEIDNYRDFGYPIGIGGGYDSPSPEISKYWGWNGTIHCIKDNSGNGGVTDIRVGKYGGIGGGTYENWSFGGNENIFFDVAGRINQNGYISITLVRTGFVGIFGTITGKLNYESGVGNGTWNIFGYSGTWTFRKI